MEITNLPRGSIYMIAVATLALSRRQLWMMANLGEPYYASDDGETVVELRHWRGKEYFMREFQPYGGVKSDILSAAIRHFLIGFSIVGSFCFPALLIDEPQNIIRFLSLFPFWVSLIAWPSVKFATALNRFKFQGIHAFTEATVETVFALAGSALAYYWIWS